MKNLIIAVLMAASINSFAQNANGQPAINDTTIKAGVFEPVLASYLSLKAALAKDNNSEAKASAKTLFESISNVQPDRLTQAQKDAWTKYSEKLTYDAQHIKGSDDIEHQREHFMSLSKNMYSFLSLVKVNTANVYYQFCPMANNGKGAYWLSDQEKISNPYLGKQMPTCGSTKETLKATK